MAVGTGYRKPVYATYTATGSTVTYGTPASLGRGVSMEWDVEVSDTNNFYADDTIAESVGGLFQRGSGTAVVDGLEQTAAKAILGLANTRTIDTVTVQGYGASEPPYVGLGFIKRVMMNGVTSYLPIIFPKVRFNMPSGSADTQEDEIDWQTQELTFSIYRDDTTNAEWMVVPTTGMATEADAAAFITGFFGA